LTFFKKNLKGVKIAIFLEMTGEITVASGESLSVYYLPDITQTNHCQMPLFLKKELSIIMAPNNIEGRHNI
jgi:hypothetical protein